MRLPLIVACLIAGSTWSFASADATTSTSNPKTAQKSYSNKPTQSTHSAQDVAAQKDPRAQAEAQREQRYPLTPAEVAQRQKVEQEQADRDAQAAIKRQAMTQAARLAKKHVVPGTGATVPAGRSQHHAQLAPANDDCSTPNSIAGLGSFAFDTTGATDSPQQSFGCATATADLWYSWVAPSSGNATMSTCASAGTLMDTVIAAYAGGACPVSGTELACNDDSCFPNLSQIVFPVTGGNTYMLQVGGYAGLTGTGTFDLSVAATIPGDDCSAPLTIAGLGSFSFDTTGASDSPQQSFYCAPATLDIWFVWTAPSTGNCTMSTCASAGSMTDTVIAAWNGPSCPISGTHLACNDDACFPNLSQIIFPVTSGNQYLLQVGGFYGQSGTGDFVLSVAPAIAGDDCASPLSISGAGTFSYDTTGATTSLQQGGVYPYANWDIWYDWTAPATGNASMTLCGLTGYDSVIKAYSGSGCPGGIPANYDDDGCCPGSFACASSMLFPCTSGSHYMLQVGGWGTTDYGPGGFTMSVVPPVPFDDCSLPVVITGNGSFPFDTTGMITGPQMGYCGTVSDDVWYQWTPTTTGVAVVDTCGSSFDTVVDVFAGAGCPSGGPITCNDQGICGGVYTNQSVMVFPVTAGSTYMIEVGGWFYGIPNYGPGTLNTNVLLPPANDDCSAAQVLPAGFGTYAFDNTAASTGVEGQSEALCSTYGNPTVGQDVWYEWTASTSGQVSFDTCGLGAVVTKLAVYPGPGCPVAGSALACSTYQCYPGTRSLFTATAGQTYTLQLGTDGYSYGGAGSFELIDASPPANDDCSAAVAISGTGSFPFDNSFATTGVDGQSEALCASQYGNPTVDHDIWFTWTSPSSGCTVIDTCGGAYIDSKLAVYPGAGCPAAGSSIACNDDAYGTCGFESMVRFVATAGQTYTIQMGTFPGAQGAASAMNIAQVAAGAGNDECSTPSVITGVGTFAYDNTAGTTGCEGQDTTCGTIGNDIWFQWTAPSTGIGVYTTCGLTSDDTVLAIYAGSGCPTPGSALACNDDSCGLQSSLNLNVTAGTTYMLQLGDYNGMPGGTGSFSLDVLPPPGPCTILDDGTPERIWSISGGADDIVWLQRYGNAGVTTTIDSIDMLYGIALAPGLAPPDGTAVDVLLYGDGVTQDGDPTDATLLSQVSTLVSGVDTDTYVNVPLPAPVTVTGYFFAGGHIQCSVGQWPAPNDRGSPYGIHGWLFGDYQNLGGANLANPGASPYPPIEIGGPLVPWGDGSLLVRVNCSFGPATYTCTPGDPGINLCPCSNPPTGSARGCDNKFATGGASITGTGTNSLAAANLVFTTANENPSVGSVLIQGTAFNAGLTFGHGVRCAAGVVKRLYVKIAVAGSITAPGPLDPSIPAESALKGNPISAGQLRVYQVYYRDTTLLLPGCAVPANQYNVTNAAQVTWAP